jgi:hypothetical protein
MPKKIIGIGVCILLITSMVPLTAPILAGENTHHESETELHYKQIPSTEINAKEWTFMLYDDADFEDAWDPLSDFTSEVYGGEKVHIIVLQDTESGPAKLWQIDENHTLILLDELGEVNMGDYATLKDFIEYCKANFPAERYIMDLYNHGAGWKGACKDDTSDGDLLTMDEMQQALAETDGIDIIMFNAPCLMGSLESAYELRNLVDVYIGSEELCGYKLGLAALICELLHTHPSLDTYEIGETIIEYVENLGGEWAHKRTMIAVQTNQLEPLKTAINKLCIDLMLRWLRSYTKINASRNQTFELGEYPDVKERYRLFDFYGFTEQLLAQDGIGPRITQDINDVQTAFDHVVLREFHGSSKPDVNGLSIYFPDSLMDGLYQQYRDRSYGLDFTEDTLWDEFLGFYILTIMILGRISQ